MLERIPSFGLEYWEICSANLRVWLEFGGKTARNAWKLCKIQIISIECVDRKDRVTCVFYHESLCCGFTSLMGGGRTFSPLLRFANDRETQRLPTVRAIGQQEAA